MFYLLLLWWECLYLLEFEIELDSIEDDGLAVGSTDGLDLDSIDEDGRPVDSIVVGVDVCGVSGAGTFEKISIEKIPTYKWVNRVQ